MDSFFTWTDLMTYGGAVMAVLIITEFTKDLPGIRRLPTRLWAYLVALVILLAKYWSFSFSIHPSNEYSGLISVRIDLFD